MDEPVFCVCVYLKDLHSSGLTLAFSGYLVNEYVFKYITLEFHHEARIWSQVRSIKKVVRVHEYHEIVYVFDSNFQTVQSQKF